MLSIVDMVAAVVSLGTGLKTVVAFEVPWNLGSSAGNLVVQLLVDTSG